MQHIAGYSSTKRTNPKKIVLSENSFTLSAGKTQTISAKVVLKKSGAKSLIQTHAIKLRYMSSNTDVATVSSTGEITAVSAGTCSIRVFTIDGVSKRVKVKVK